MSEHANMAAADLDHMARLRQERDAARADSAALREAILAYTTSATVDDRTRLRCEAYDLAVAPHPGAPLLAELDAARRVVVAARAALNGALFEYRRPLEEALEAYQTTTTTALDTRKESAE